MYNQIVNSNNNGENRILAISEELSHRENTEKIGMFDIKGANQTLQEAAKRPNPTPLWDTLWYEGEISCLFADANVGKSIYAVQIGTEIAQKQKVLYFDFELSDKQFQLRYTADDGTLYTFPENLYRVEINPESLDVQDFENALFVNIEEAAQKTEAKVLIIDNLTWLCTAAEKGDLAGRLMIKLLGLKKKYGWSILILAHTPKRLLTSPITQNDLAGSKKLFNFFDSVFSIGFSAKYSEQRYIKQLKVRYGNYTYNADNVIVATIKKEGAFPRFDYIRTASEREHLKELSEDDLAAITSNVKKLMKEGLSYQEIANRLGISKSRVQRIQKKL